MSILAIIDPTPGNKRFTPYARSAKTFPLYNRDVILTVGGYGIIVAGAWVDEAKVPKRLAWLRAHNAGSRLVLRADRTIKVAEIRRILVMARDAGYSQLTIETMPCKSLFHRRLESWPRVFLDRSVLHEPPEEGIVMRLDQMWH